MPTETLTRALSVTDAGPARIPLARGVRAGHWVFIAGLLPDDLGDAERPRSGAPAWLRQAKSVWQSAADILRAGGADVSRLVRCDQFFQDWRAVPFFHQARRACGAYIAPSTSVLQPEMLIPGAAMMTDMIAVAADGPAIEPIFPDGLDIPSTSSFVPVVKAGNLVFVAGFLRRISRATWAASRRRPRCPTGICGRATASSSKAAYLIREKLILRSPAPASAPATWSRPTSICRTSRTCWRSIRSGPKLSPGRFQQRRSFPPARRALRSPTRAWRSIWSPPRRRLERIESGRAAYAICYGHPVAVRAGDILLFSGMVAADPHGLIEAARIDDRSRYLASSIEGKWTISSTLPRRSARGPAPACERGPHLQLHTDLADFLPACRVWQRRLPGLPLPISAARVPAPLLVPGCSVALDLWVYAPQ